MAEKKTHRCPHEGCGVSFSRPYRLAQHLLVHDNIKAFVCPNANCSKAYTNKSHLDRHLNTAHQKLDKDEINRCPTCFKIYSNRQNLKRHIKIQHNLKIPFSCDTCKLDFPKKHMLTAHMYQHTGIKSFCCELCSAEFISLLEKKKHLRSHRTHSCPKCPFKIKQWSRLQKHMKLEHGGNEYICNECARSFKQRGHLVRHIKIHNVPKIFSCPYENCNRFYSRNSNLKQHIAIKHARLLHECDICNAQLSTKAKLEAHVLRQHINDSKKRVYKTKATGRCVRKDDGSFKLSTALKLAGLLQEPRTPGPSFSEKTEVCNMSNSIKA
ncbi:gastrula zinc finger protein XlCGF8.2DB-like [Hyposmocoma kahamanoa]|uniref:gastrula zinc finger protein XlCGF8.2DB-like n=1 Tax=Hyposmocoma kahamanoa TaxID=1477025 RepID=UPI000E6D7CD5|nr:gastrula zinc finger protein XlCGF8.2DB-like [Hyposmocoma kahamanoa]